jgi:hypothetical protein
MISEACYLGKPVEIWPLPFSHKRFDRFFNQITEGHHAVMAEDPYPPSFKALRERDRVLPMVIQGLNDLALMQNELVKK